MQAHIKSRTQDVKVMGTNGMDGCEIEAQCSIVGICAIFKCFYHH